MNNFYSRRQSRRVNKSNNKTLRLLNYQKVPPSMHFQLPKLVKSINLATTENVKQGACMNQKQ